MENQSTWKIMNFLTERCFQKRRCHHKSGESLKNSMGALCSLTSSENDIGTENPLLCSLYPPWTVGAEFLALTTTKTWILSYAKAPQIQRNSAKPGFNFGLWQNKIQPFQQATNFMSTTRTPYVSVACGYLSFVLDGFWFYTTEQGEIVMELFSCLLWICPWTANNYANNTEHLWRRAKM